MNIKIPLIAVLTALIASLGIATPASAQEDRVPAQVVDPSNDGSIDEEPAQDWSGTPLETLELGQTFAFPCVAGDRFDYLQWDDGGVCDFSEAVEGETFVGFGHWRYDLNVVFDSARSSINANGRLDGSTYAYGEMVDEFEVHDFGSVIDEMPSGVDFMLECSFNGHHRYYSFSCAHINDSGDRLDIEAALSHHVRSVRLTSQRGQLTAYTERFFSARATYTSVVPDVEMSKFRDGHHPVDIIEFDCTDMYMTEVGCRVDDVAPGYGRVAFSLRTKEPGTIFGLPPANDTGDTVSLSEFEPNDYTFFETWLMAGGSRLMAVNEPNEVFDSFAELVPLPEEPESRPQRSEWYKHTSTTSTCALFAEPSYWTAKCIIDSWNPMFDGTHVYIALRPHEHAISMHNPCLGWMAATMRTDEVIVNDDLWGLDDPYRMSCRS